MAGGGKFGTGDTNSGGYSRPTPTYSQSQLAETFKVTNPLFTNSLTKI